MEQLKTVIATEKLITDRSMSKEQNSSRNLSSTIAALGPKLAHKGESSPKNRSPSKPRSAIADIQRKPSPCSTPKIEHQKIKDIETDYLLNNADLDFKDLDLIIQGSKTGKSKR